MSDLDYDVVASGNAMGDAEPDTERKLGAFPNPDLRESPVVPLGFYAGKVVFAMPEGEIRHELASKIGGMLRPDIFACEKGQSFLTYWRDSEDKFQRDLATIWFVRKCRSAGFWNSDRAVRSLGVWPGDLGAVILHRGAELHRYMPDGSVQVDTIADALRNTSGPLYRLCSSAAAPSDPCPRERGVWLRSRLDRWGFEAIGDEGLKGADVVAGWIMASLLGAVSPFRGHLMLNALAGSGKSTLIEFIHACLSALAGDVIDSFSEAGFKNELSGMARPVLIDEAEASSGANGPGVLERVLEVIRRMATGHGGTRKQGDVGGGTVTQTAIGSVLMAGINPPKLASADASRVAEVRLQPLNRVLGAERFASDAEMHATIAEAKALAPALLGRALAGAARYRSDFDAIKAAFVKSKEAPRTADLMAMIAAGRRLLLLDEPIETEDEADAEVLFWRPLLAQREAAQTVSNPGAEALAHLMSANSGQHRHDRHLTLGEVIQGQIGPEGGGDEHVLKANGLKLYRGDWADGSPGPWLIVANQHPALERIFERSSWRDWRRSLGYLDELGEAHQTKVTTPQRFGLGVLSRGIAIPLTPWLEGRTHGVTTVTDSVTSEPRDW